MTPFYPPTIVCRCGRVFFDGENVWPHVREEHEREKRNDAALREMMMMAQTRKKSRQ